MPRYALRIGSLALLVGALAGCATEPEPAWTEDEAYAAAEETFRGYWTSLNDENADPLQYLTHEMQEIHLDGDKRLSDQGIKVRGKTTVDTFDVVSFRLVDDVAVVIARSCVDGSAIQVRMDEGEWETPRDDPTYGVEVNFESAGPEMLIAHLTESSDLEC